MRVKLVQKVFLPLPLNTPSMEGCFNRGGRLGRGFKRVRSEMVSLMTYGTDIKC